VGIEKSPGTGMFFFGMPRLVLIVSPSLILPKLARTREPVIA